MCCLTCAGWDGRPHPDNSSHEKHRLSVSGIEKIMKTFAPGMSACYIWLDFGCMDQDGDPAGELKQLDEIVRCSDCLFTPLAGEGHLSIFYNSWSDIYQDYRADTWNADKFGYVNRGWCRVEMFFAANIPAVNNSERVERLSQGLKTFVSRGVRPHFLYGTHERKENILPRLIPPMQNSYFEKYHPAKGEVSVPRDKVKIEELVQQLL